MSEYIKTFKVKDRDKGKNKKLMSVHIDDEKLLEKYKTIWTKIEDLKNIELNALTVYDDGYIEFRIGKCGNKVYTNFCGLNMPEDNIECEYFTVIFINSLLVYENKYYLQVYLGNCTHRIVDNKMIDYLSENANKTDEGLFLKNTSYKYCITTESI